MNNCKPGDLAIVINTTVDENYGLLVSVLGTFSGCFPDGSFFYGGELWVPQGSGPLWECEALGRPFVCRKGNKYQRQIVADSRLRPIKGASPEETAKKGLEEKV